jgi:hypothetical protein
MLSLLIWPKVIQLSGGHCITFSNSILKLQSLFSRLFSLKSRIAIAKLFE